MATSDSALLQAMLGASDSGIDAASEYVLQTAKSLSAPEIQWLWEGYLLRGKLTLIDARGGSGKTRLFLAIAACVSQGVFPFGIGGEPVTLPAGRSMLMSGEDDPEESAQTYNELSGVADNMFFYSPSVHGELTFDDAGITRLENLIRVNGISLVGVDPVLQFMPKDVRGQTDNQGITQCLSRLNGVARRTNASIVMIRHWAMNLTAREINQLGAGGESWRNVSRGQRILLPHPENNTRRDWMRSLVVNGRHTQRVRYEGCFEIAIDKGVQTFIHPRDVDLTPYIDAFPSLGAYLGVAPSVSAGTRGPKPGERQRAAQLIVDYLVAHGRAAYSRDVREALDALGVNKNRFYEAKNELVSTEYMTDDRGRWSLTERADPFSDNQPWWVE